MIKKNELKRYLDEKNLNLKKKLTNSYFLDTTLLVFSIILFFLNIQNITRFYDNPFMLVFLIFCVCINILTAILSVSCHIHTISFGLGELRDIVTLACFKQETVEEVEKALEEILRDVEADTEDYDFVGEKNEQHD